MQRFPLGRGVWHKNGVNEYPRARRALPPLDDRQLEELALKYVGRFDTTRMKLANYLKRKLRERGWDGAREPDPQGLAEKLARLGYIDDAAFALAKAQSLTSRGFGQRRLSDTLRHAGVDPEDGQAAREHAEQEAVSAALRLAERRRIGPFAARPPGDPREREKAIGALVRAGHSFALARVIIDWPPDTPVDPAEVADRARLTGA